MADNLFDEHFQAHFVSHMLRDSEFLLYVKDDVTPELFSNELTQRVVRIVKEHGDSENAAPGTLIFTQLNDLKAKRLLSDELHKSITTYIDGLFAGPLQNAEFLRKQFDRFVRHQMFSKEILPAAKLVKDGNFDDAEEILAKCFSYRARRSDDLGRRFIEDPSARVERRKSGDKERLWLLIPELDSLLGGSTRGELFVWQSQRSSSGKSAAMVYCTRSFVFQGKKVLIISLEMSEDAYEDRLDMCVSGITKDSLLDRTRIQNSMRKMFKRGGDVWIKQFPGQLTSVEHLRKYVHTLENVHNFHPDVIMLDYADELSPSDKRMADNSYMAGKLVYGEFRGWLVEDNLFGMTGMQSNRSGMEATVADMEHAGESIAKIQISDTVVSINRSPAEVQAGLTSCYIVKHREGLARMSVSIRTDFNRMQFRIGADA